MPSRPSFADVRNTQTLLSALAEPATLQDGSVLAVIVRQRRLLTWNGEESVERLHTSIAVPWMLRGSLREHQSIHVRQQRFYVVAVREDGPDGWLSAGLSESPITP